jgi:hypothetical protein
MRDRKAAAIIFTGLLLTYVYIFPHWVDWNQNARFDLAAAIVERGTLSIDDYRQNTGDYALYNGHTYIDKAPGSSFLGVPIYALFSPLTRIDAVQSAIDTLGRSPAVAATLNRPIGQVTRGEFVLAANVALVSGLTVALPSALLGVILFIFLGWLDYSAWTRVLAILIYGVATPAFTYSAVIYGHQPAAVMLFVAFAWLHALRHRAGRRLELFIIGSLLGYAMITEYPAALIAASIGLYAIGIVRPRPRLTWLIAGGAWPLLLLGAYNAAIFGSPFRFGYQYTADPHWRAILSTGFFSANWPTLEAAWGLTFSPFRGLFFASPTLLLAVPGLVLLRRSIYRAEWLLTLAITVGFFLLVSASAQWWGGWAAGPRYLIPMLSFLVWPLAATIDRIEHARLPLRRWLSLIVIVMLALSLVNTWSLTAGGQYFAPDDISNPLFSYSWPHIATGDVARNWGMIIGLGGIWSLLPLALIAGATFGLGWHVTRSEGGQRDFASHRAVDTK